MIRSSLSFWRICLALALSLSACAGAQRPLSAHLLDPELAPHPSCPPNRFLVAASSSDKGQEDAELRARAAVARKISSAIQVETERMAELSQKDGVFQSERQLRQVIKEEAGYRHAELIEIVGPSEMQGGLTYALACLDRQRATAVALQELTMELTRFEDAARRATAAWKQNDRAAFARDFREARLGAPPLVPLFAQLRALSGGTSEEEGRFNQQLRQLFEAANQLRADSSVLVAHVQSDLPEDLRNDVTQSLQAALLEVGVRAQVASAKACDAAAEGTYLLQLESAALCRWGSLGHVCRPQIALAASECTSGRVLFRTSVTDAGQGSDPREADRALRKAIGGFGPEKVEGQLRELFSAEIPLPEKNR